MQFLLLCFHHQDGNWRHTHHNRRLFACTQIVENCRQKSETVRLSKAGWQRHKHVSPANKFFYSLLLLVFQALQAECLYCCVDSGIDLLFAVPGYVYLVSSPAPPSGWSERERRRVWEITQGRGVLKECCGQTTNGLSRFRRAHMSTQE